MVPASDQGEDNQDDVSYKEELVEVHSYRQDCEGGCQT